MPLYFFHFRDQHGLYEDCEGVELPDLHAALEEVLRIDRELAVEPASLHDLEFEITDSRGRTALKVPIQERRWNPDLLPAPQAEDQERHSPAKSTPKRLH